LVSERWTDASRIVAVGYCFGGAVVLELARGGADVIRYFDEIPYRPC
jgi:dienelactone hydrolase